ncbi:hypothetical protein THAOC_36997 [Thalassiosira oceanica]|uniref:Uncharacterized protein n=1 Tax=Thalassiosira oceanica TaxID=159749 RepID=K0R6Y2_THAOC|nr:hypothetical protein THAOC_36997 [Thalassiosira oceanica]|eukprot:EJK44456.1 hypothetical protein THAOC_36997 [Thalassiosira oceanica]
MSVGDGRVREERLSRSRSICRSRGARREPFGGRRIVRGDFSSDGSGERGGRGVARRGLFDGHRWGGRLVWRTRGTLELTKLANFRSLLPKEGPWRGSDGTGGKSAAWRFRDTTLELDSDVTDFSIVVRRLLRVMRQSTSLKRGRERTSARRRRESSFKNCAVGAEAGGAARRREPRAETAQFLPCGAVTLAGRADHRERKPGKGMEESIAGASRDS